MPADIRLMETQSFCTDEFILTGDSLPQGKDAELVVERECSYSGQNNLVFTGTTVARGHARGVVFGTGIRTAIGEIATISESIERGRSPLQREMDTQAKTLTKLAGLIALALFAANVLLRGAEYESLQLLINGSLLFAIGVAAACVPQGLPAQISVALSLGVSRLARKHAIVKRLSAVETPGSTTVICSDKTGTITANGMTIVHCWLNGRDLDVTGAGYDPKGDIRQDGEPLAASELEACKQFFEDGFLASHGRTHPPDESHRTWYAIGDPTEAAFMPLAVKARLDPEDLETRFPLIQELPFDSDRKRMTMVREHKGRTIAYMKGAAASVLEVCSAIHRDGGPQPLTDADREAVLDQAQLYSANTLRVIALAYRDFRRDRLCSPEARMKRNSSSPEWWR